MKRLDSMHIIVMIVTNLKRFVYNFKIIDSAKIT